MTSLLNASTPEEVEYFFLATQCPQCGQGPWEVHSPTGPGAGGLMEVHARCGHCQAQHDWTFRIRNLAATPQGEVPAINPDPQPSEIVDVAQWMGLFHAYIERAAREADKHQARLLGYRAASCLAEALKFYDSDDELPGEEAFFHEASREAYHRFTERFARRRLRDMQAKLPSLDTMERALARGALRRRGKSPWWRFWRR